MIFSLFLFQDEDEDFDPDYVLEEEIYDVDCEFF